MSENSILMQEKLSNIVKLLFSRCFSDNFLNNKVYGIIFHNCNRIFVHFHLHSYQVNEVKK